MKVGDLVVVGGNEGMLTEVQHLGGGHYSGKGMMSLPWLKTRFAVFFTDITVVGGEDEAGGIEG